MSRRRTILVDGYNLIGATRGLRAHDLERAREALLDRMSAYARARGHEVIVVFDGADLPVDYYPRKGRTGVRAVFTDPGEKADPVLVAEARRRQGRCVVVTDDGQVRRACDEAGAVVLACEEFEGFVRRARSGGPPEAARGAAPGGIGGRAREPRLSAGAPAPAGRPRDHAGRSGEAVGGAPDPDDIEAWQRFAAGVTPLPGRGRPAPCDAVLDVSSRASAPLEDETAPDGSGLSPHLRPADLIEALLDVPDEVARQRSAEDAAYPPEAPRGPRHVRRRKNVLEDL